ncbi:shikimate and dehydroshikimate transport protein (putative); MFS family transporter [Cupriavidus taiwanensis]|uniref:Shikimate and dehydroshikimate transport protein (Putative) MFS family transporter n=1 Tax=Cupriavidus taiwanensis TaxID=164546 RepID=A0A375E8N1_9BURK|nr:MFS transporter [Cupriavidus taiwanensis]SOZ65509.1 shikimate and dehydroshikimate transport protein (putative); MFS family transporter [Cupriavidus taiwanensis]SOZ66807.1 shikimate and dehydroshikimate transport protein (putative); MFS family transporter [Cupriavidus taiwanensis]SOZ70113.1 shikimate and dehydroshikimate transport protein (putative); MFS family transporter [Cupriavidus taiwanensis]SPA08670.1 shikimate and dehydroshikimate transport protein (putative); MFS family transporter 
MTSPNEQAIRKVALASVIGATIEWYDFFLYGVVAGLVFNKLYFPGDDPLVATMLAYTTFAVGFVTRPLGGVIFGHFGDKVGRKSMLVMTLMIMGVSTFLIGLVPTYDSIGIMAPVLLLLLRVLQGIGLGGEWGGAVLMAYEYAPAHRKGFYASLPQIGLAIGLCLASGVVALLSLTLTDAQFLAWGWRVAFLISAAMVFVGMYIRLNVKETPEFAVIKQRNAETQIPFVDMMRRYPGNIVKGMGARYIDGVFFNIFGVFSITYLTQTVNISRTQALVGVMAAAIAMCFFIPFFGHLSDRTGRTRVYFWGALITALSAFPAFWLMLNSGGNTMLLWLAIVVPFGILYAAVYGPEAALFCELFDARVRYTGISFVYQFSGIFASGITPIIATALLKSGGGQPWQICAYVAFAGLVSALSVALIGRGAGAEAPRESGVPLRGPAR